MHGLETTDVRELDRDGSDGDASGRDEGTEDHDRTGSWRGLEQHRGTLARFLAMRCRDENEAEDLIQETLLRAARYRSKLSDGSRLRSWMVQIAANVFRDHVRRSYRRPAVTSEEELFDWLEGDEPEPGHGDDDAWILLDDEPIERQVVLGYLRAAFHSLAEHDRRVLSSYYGGAECTSRTARECGIRPALVKVRLFRARRRLERSIRHRVFQARADRLVHTA